MQKNFSIGMILISVAQVFYCLRSLTTLLDMEKLYAINEKTLELVMLLYFLYLLLGFTELFGISERVRFWFRIGYYVLVVTDIAYLSTEYSEVMSHIARVWFATTIGIVGSSLIYYGIKNRSRGFEFVGIAFLSWLFQGALESILLAINQFSFFAVTVIGAINTSVLIYGFYLVSQEESEFEVARESSVEQQSY